MWLVGSGVKDLASFPSSFFMRREVGNEVKPWFLEYQISNSCYICGWIYKEFQLFDGEVDHVNWYISTDPDIPDLS